MTKNSLELRHALHRHPELSGQEGGTARRILDFFRPLAPDRVLESLGGTGLAFVFGTGDGPTVLLRCELDALPIHETTDLPYRSRCDGVAHKCGHDGHMAVLAEVGLRLASSRPRRGRVVLLFQPAEETGAGAAAILADPRFGDEIKPDWVYALHNLPGFPLGRVLIKDGPFNCASRGMTVRYSGRTSHAAQPEKGISPARAMAQTVTELAALVPSVGRGFVTVVGARLGGKIFGTSPGEAEVYATLRTESDGAMADLRARAEALAREAANRDGLGVEMSYEDVFTATSNTPRAVDRIRRVLEPDTLEERSEPFRWSEDFGRFTARFDGALFGLGAGERCPALHHPDYDFPDALIDVGADIFIALVAGILDPEAFV